MSLFTMVFDEQEKQILIKGLAELVAKESYNLINKIASAPLHNPATESTQSTGESDATQKE